MRYDKLNEVATTKPVELGAQITFPNGILTIICRVVQVREKAVRVDYTIEPAIKGAYLWNEGVIIYTDTCWLPKAVIIDGEKGLPVKTWFNRSFEGGEHIKPYYMEDNKHIFI